MNKKDAWSFLTTDYAQMSEQECQEAEAQGAAVRQLERLVGLAFTLEEAIDILSFALAYSQTEDDGLATVHLSDLGDPLGYLHELLKRIRTWRGEA